MAVKAIGGKTAVDIGAGWAWPAFWAWPTACSGTGFLQPAPGFGLGILWFQPVLAW